MPPQNTNKSSLSSKVNSDFIKTLYVLLVVILMGASSFITYELTNTNQSTFSSNKSNVILNNTTPINKSTIVPSTIIPTTSLVSTKINTDPLLYVNSEYKYSINIPSDWLDKYTIVESNGMGASTEKIVNSQNQNFVLASSVYFVSDKVENNSSTNTDSKQTIQDEPGFSSSLYSHPVFFNISVYTKDNWNKVDEIDKNLMKILGTSDKYVFVNANHTKEAVSFNDPVAEKEFSNYFNERINVENSFKLL